MGYGLAVFERTRTSRSSDVLGLVGNANLMEGWSGLQQSRECDAKTLEPWLTPCCRFPTVEWSDENNQCVGGRHRLGGRLLHCEGTHLR